MAKLIAGDRIAYAARFLKDTGQFTGNAGFRRGTYIGPAAGFPPNFCRVTWDDIESVIAEAQGQYADAEYVADVREHGALVGATAIAKVGSARFASNDL
jgi:hypothetical protein